jgi:hypothetical protein
MFFFKPQYPLYWYFIRTTRYYCILFVASILAKQYHTKSNHLFLYLDLFWITSVLPHSSEAAPTHSATTFGILATSVLCSTDICCQTRPDFAGVLLDGYHPQHIFSHLNPPDVDHRTRPGFSYLNPPRSDWYHPQFGQSGFCSVSSPLS